MSSMHWRGMQQAQQQGQWQAKFRGKEEYMQQLKRTMFTKYNNHHPKALVFKTAITKTDGRRGLIDIIK